MKMVTFRKFPKIVTGVTCRVSGQPVSIEPERSLVKTVGHELMAEIRRA